MSSIGKSTFGDMKELSPNLYNFLMNKDEDKLVNSNIMQFSLKELVSFFSLDEMEDSTTEALLLKGSNGKYSNANEIIKAFSSYFLYEPFYEVADFKSTYTYLPHTYKRIVNYMLGLEIDNDVPIDYLDDFVKYEDIVIKLLSENKLRFIYIKDMGVGYFIDNRDNLYLDREEVDKLYQACFRTDYSDLPEIKRTTIIKSLTETVIKHKNAIQHDISKLGYNSKAEVNPNYLEYTRDTIHCNRLAHLLASVQ